MAAKDQITIEHTLEVAKLNPEITESILPPESEILPDKQAIPEPVNKPVVSEPNASKPQEILLVETPPEVSEPAEVILEIPELELMENPELVAAETNPILLIETTEDITVLPDLPEAYDTPQQSIEQEATQIEVEELVFEANITVSEEVDDLPTVATALVEALPIEPDVLAEKLQTIPTERLEEAAAILELVLETAQRIQQQIDIGETDYELVEAGLEQMIERLLVCLEVEYEDSDIEVFVQMLLEGNLELLFEKPPADEYDAMHERKYASDWIMSVLNQKLATKQTSHSFIGKLIMRLSLAENQLVVAV